MKPIRLLGLAMFLAAAPAFPGIVFTITPTNRVEDQTTVRLTYLVTGAADVGTQPVGDYFVRVVVPVPLQPSVSNVSNIFRAPDLTPWGPNPSGPFTTVTITPTFTQVRMQASTSTGANQVIDTTGGMIGQFDVTWLRPVTGQYDAALNVEGAYRVAPFTSSTPFTLGINVTNTGVSTIVSPVPEPGSLPLLGLGVLGAGLAGWRRHGHPALPARL